MSKRLLMLSTAVTALLTSAALAETTISSDTTTALTTGTLITGGEGTADAGDITVDSDGSIKISKSGIAVVTIDSDNWLYANGTLKNSDKSSAYGIYVDVSSNPDLTDASITSEANSTYTGVGILLDSSSTLELTDDGTGKYGLYFNGVSGSGTYTGDVMVYGSAISIEGASSSAVYFSSNSTFVGDFTFDSTASVSMSGGSSYFFNLASGATFTGDLTLGSSTAIAMEDDSNTAIYLASGSTFTGDIVLGGSIVLSPEKIRSTTNSELQAILLQGTLDGNLTIGSAASIGVIGEGAKGLTVEGGGITGALTIAGTVSTVGYSASYDSEVTNYYSKTLSTYPEASTALAIGANIDNGVMIVGASYSGGSSYSGTVSTSGTDAAVLISPEVNTTVDQTSSLTIGVYQYEGELDTYNPGFSFYNRGTISASPMNSNNSALAFYTEGSSAYPTIFTGGFYNSGAISASGSTNDEKTTSISASAVVIGDYTYLDNATFDTVTGTWSDASLASKESDDDAAFVNSNDSSSGTISAAVSGYQAGLATAISIAKTAQVPSLINSGTISATALTSDQELTTTIDATSSDKYYGYTVYAVAIVDYSGTLTSIYNTGTISAVAGVGTSSSSTISQLDNDMQLAVAIDLRGNEDNSPSTAGVTITERGTATSAASIVGDIYFGTGDNQVIDIQGTSTTYTATITGDIVYGATGNNDIAHTLQIGAYGVVSGKVTAGSGAGVAVNIDSNGALYLKNDTEALNAASVHVADSGILSIGVSQKLTSDGAIASQGTVILDEGSKFYLSYNSFIPQGEHDYTLITAAYEDIQIDSGTLATANTNLTKNVSDSGTLPYLFKSASLEVTSSSTAGDALVLHILPKTSDQLGLVGYAQQLFPYVNDALAVDDTLGSAMIYGIHNATEAQTAYSAYAPNVTGGDRAVAISITDSATGPIAARQRSLLMYARGDASTSVWAHEFVQMIKDPGQGAESLEGTRELSGFKDSGFGISVGIDTGSKKYGWYGGAITFYAGDVGELKRPSKTHEQWLLLSGYSVWRGKGLFLNSKIDLGYGKFDGTRSVLLYYTTSSTLNAYARTATNKREGVLLSGAVSTGAYLNYGAATFSPTLSVDGMMLRENGYTEYNNGTATEGDAFDLKIQPYYAKSLRAFLGLDVRYDIDLTDFFLQPELRAGYRYDFFNDPQKLKVAFAHINVDACTTTVTTACGTPGEEFTVTGPDPARGSLVLGSSLSATTEAWTLGFHFDLLRGDNGTIQQVGTLSIVGKI